MRPTCQRFLSIESLRLHLSTAFVVLASLTSCSQQIMPATYTAGYRNIQHFFERQFNFDLFYDDVAQNSEKPHRVLVSFIVKKNGAVDSFAVHEKTSDQLTAETARIIQLSSGKWTPQKINGIAGNSPRIFFPVYIFCADCKGSKSEKMEKINRQYFKDYNFKGLPEWNSNSIIHKDVVFVVYQPVK